MKIKLYLSLLIAVTVVSCSKPSQNTGELFDSIKVGMTINEAKTVLGKPTSSIEEISGHMVLWKMEDGTTIAVTTDEAGKITSTSRGAK